MMMIDIQILQIWYYVNKPIRQARKIKFLTPWTEQSRTVLVLGRRAEASQPVSNIYQIAISSVPDRSYLANLGISGPADSGHFTTIMDVEPQLKEFNCIWSIWLTTMYVYLSQWCTDTTTIQQIISKSIMIWFDFDLAEKSLAPPLHPRDIW